MNPYEYAMNMELEGKKFYQEQAEGMTDPILKKIYEELAADEDRHYSIFKAMLEGKEGDFEQAFKTDILKTTKNVFQTLIDTKAELGEYPTDVKEAWIKARDIEDKAEEFYRQQALKASSEQERETWLKIADEEHKHYVAMDHVVNFVSSPKQYLENAEWSALDHV